MSEMTSARPGRRWVLGAVAAGAAAAGAGLAWWRMRPAPIDDPVATALWAQRFDGPSGAPLVMADLRGGPVLLNFWATWCAPCVQEMPMLDRFFRENAASGWKVVGLAIDQPTSVRQFLARTPVTFPIGLAGLEGTELARGLGNTVGGLPFSVLLSADGRVRERKMGQLTEADLAQWKAVARA